MKTKSNAGQKNPEKTAQKTEKKCLWILAAALVVVSVVTGILLTIFGKKEHVFVNKDDMFMLLGEQGKFLFESVDLDRDGKLSVREFAPLVEKITGIVPPSARHAEGEGEMISLKTFFKPLVINSMKITKDVASFVDAGKFLVGLKKWRTPRIVSEEYNTLDFSIFMPNKRNSRVGDTWSLYTGFDDLLPSQRYFPPPPEGADAILYRLLRMIHSRPFLQTRFGPKGGVAVLRAENDQYLDISFRIHAEFQLNEPPAPPFWFTPAQLNGSIIISRSGQKIKNFILEVPSNRKLNVDMEWMTSTIEDGMEVDIGYLPVLSITSIKSSAPFKEKSSEQIHVEGTSEWTAEISKEEATGKLEKTFYPFKEVKYYPIEEAFAKAIAENKLVHSIAIWGALDDQSC